MREPKIRKDNDMNKEFIEDMVEHGLGELATKIIEVAKKHPGVTGEIFMQETNMGFRFLSPCINDNRFDYLSIGQIIFSGSGDVQFVPDTRFFATAAGHDTSNW